MNAKQSILRYIPWPTILRVVASVIIALVSGLAVLVDSFQYPSLILLAGFSGIAILWVWLRKPVWAVYTAVFVVFLPTNLIPAEINSLLNRAITMIALVVWLVNVLARRQKIILTSSTVWMLCFLTWAGLSLLGAAYFSEGMTALQMYGMRLILFMILIINEIRTKKDLDGLMYTLALAGGLLVVVSMITILTRGYTFGTQLQVLGVNENTLGVSLIITTPCVLWWAQNNPGRIVNYRKILAAIFLLLAILLTSLSGSRGSAISFGVTLAAFLVWRPTRFWGLFGLLIIGIAILIAPFIFSTTIDRFLGVTGDTILGGRETIWPAGFQLILNHLWSGVGIGNSDLRIIPYLGDLGYITFSGGSLHNPILSVTAETGIPGLFLYLGILVSAGVSFIKQYVRYKKNNITNLLPYFALIAATFLGYMISWIKGGGMEKDFSYYLMLALLLVPSHLQTNSSPG